MAVQQILTLTQLSQDRAANTSQVRILWKSTQTGGSHNLTERTARYWVDTGAGETEHTVTYRLNRVSTDTILDTTVTVAHDVSGNGSITVRTWMDTRISAGEVTLTQTLVLTPIPRASAVSAADGTIGGRTTVAISAADTNVTHTLRGSFEQLEFWVDCDGNLTDQPQQLGQRVLQMELPETFYYQLPNSAEGRCHLVCTTYREGVALGATQCSFTVAVDRVRCAPAVTGRVADRNQKTVALTGDPGKLVRGQSIARCTAEATPAPGATIAQLRVGTGVMENGMLDLTGVQSGSFEFRATDSRGNTGTCLVELPMVEYVQLSVNATAVRSGPTTGKVRVNITGNYYAGSFGAADNTLQLYCSVGGDTPFALQAAVTGNTYAAVTELEGLDYNQSHLITVTATDALMQVRRDLQLQPGTPVFDWGRKDFQFHVPVTMPQLYLPGGAVGDHVIQWGYDERWFWRKWASGFAECRGWNNYTVATADTPWGGLYCADTPSPRLEYPISFWESPVEVVTMRPAVMPCVHQTVEYNTATDSGVYNFLTEFPVTTEQFVTMEYYVTGYWKLPEEEIV